MARLESQAKAGYYPTPQIVVEQVADAMRLPYVRGGLREKSVFRLLDPCCGTGDALMLLGERLRKSDRAPVETFGVELSAERVDIAKGVLDTVLAADLFGTSIAHEAFSLLYLNPPYDDEGQSEDGKKRTELAFLQRTTPYLAEGGLLVFIVPKRILRGNIARYLSSHYYSLTCFDFPEAEREAFGQVVVIGKRRVSAVPFPNIEEQVRRWATDPPPPPKITSTGFYDRFELKFVDAGPVLFANMFLDPWAVADEAAVKGLWVNPLVRSALWPDTDERRRPLMPLRQGHVAMLTAAGFLDNLMLERDGQRILVKGKTFKEFEIVEETEEKIVLQERMRTSVVTLDLDTGIFSDIRT